MTVIVPLSILLPIFIGIIKFRWLPVTARVLFWFLIITAIVNGIATIMGRYLHKNNNPLTHAFTVIELLLLLAYYKYLFSPGKKNKSYAIVAVVFIVLCIVNALFFQSIFIYNSYTRSAEAIICMLLALNYFARLASGSTGNKFVKQPDFYFNTGIFLYFSGAFILFLFSNFIVVKLSLHDFLAIWGIHAALVLLMYLFFSTAFLLCKK
ncbi:MAG: hypothetical protein ABI685_04855 [Ferruginibacter sp.]